MEETGRDRMVRDPFSYRLVVENDSGQAGGLGPGEVLTTPRPGEKPLPRMRLAGIEGDSDLASAIGCVPQLL
jgi:hypothetical protein